MSSDTFEATLIVPAETRSTYRAVQAVAPGRLELAELPLREPGLGEVRVRVEACGVCHTDAMTVERVFPIAYPRVPGHEIVGRIEAVGPGVKGWTVGERVGVGFLAGNCGYCRYCREGNLASCENQEFTGIQQDGGYAEQMIAKASGLVRMPGELEAVAAAPLLCAGLTTFSALRNSPAKAGDLVAIVGIGGLGHLAIQYARHMGFEVAAIARGPDKAELALRLGAYHYIDSQAVDPAEALQALGGAMTILVTAAGGDVTAATFKGLRARGTSIVVGAGAPRIQLQDSDLIFGNKRLEGATTGDFATADATLRFSVLTGVASMNEIYPLEQAAEAYARMMSGEARFRVVLTMG
jgi:propanol-preferring alcohol dehydrogenase